MKRNYDGSIRSTRNYPADYIPDVVNATIGKNAVNTGCTRRVGKSRRTKLRSLVNAMLSTKTFLYQSLGGTNALYNWRQGGGAFLTQYYSEGSATEYPQTITYPIYIYRLGVANGAMTDFPSSSTPYTSAPLICYRLQSTRASAGSSNIYKWTSWSSGQSVISAATNSDGPSGARFNNHNYQTCVIEETIDPFAAERIRHDSSTVKLLYTNPTQLSVPLVCGVIKFTKDTFCPPDEYGSNTDTNPYVAVNAIKANAGAYNISVPVPADGVVQRQYTDFWDHYIRQRDGHPLRSDPRSPTPRNVFNFVAKFARLVGSQQSIAYGTGTQAARAPTGIQHQHVERIAGMGWKNTSIHNVAESLQPQDDQNNFRDQIVRNNVGIFPKPTEQRWFMVSAWARRGTAAAESYDIGITPTFDISITQRFSIVDEL